MGNIFLLTGILLEQILDHNKTMDKSYITVLLLAQSKVQNKTIFGSYIIVTLETTRNSEISLIKYQFRNVSISFFDAYSFRCPFWFCSGNNFILADQPRSACTSRQCKEKVNRVNLRCHECFV